MTALKNIFSFIFINSKINTLLFYLQTVNLSETEIFKEATNAKSIYKKLIRRHLGLGFFLSFIPGTEAFLARENLLLNIKKLESIEEIDGTKTIPALWTNVFMRTIRSMLHYAISIDFATILLRKEESFVGVNRLNPFLYPLKLLFSFMLYYVDLFKNNEQGLSFIQIIVVAVGFILGLIGWPLIGLYLVTEFILNSLHTLLIEPFIFAYEAIHQLVTNWNRDLALMPTDEFNKVDRLADAVHDELITDAKRNKTLNLYQTKELILIDSTEQVIHSLKEYQHSSYFKLNKDTDIFEQNDTTIAKSYNQFKKLQQFSYFTQKEMPIVFPKELTGHIANILFKLNSPINKAEEGDKAQEQVVININGQ